MGFEKGNKLGGRKVGSKGKANQDIREAFKDILIDNLDKLNDDVKQLEPRDRIKAILDISNYILPKLRSTDKIIEVQELKNFNIKDLYNDAPMSSEEKQIFKQEIKDFKKDFDSKY